VKTISYETLHHQFVLSSSGTAEIEGWRAYRCCGYSLMCHPSLPVNSVLDSAGTTIGYVLGWPIDQPGRLIRTQVRIPFQLSASTIDSLEREVYGFGGRYAFVILAPDAQRLYLDPAGTLSAVFFPKRKLAGSTVAALVLDEPDHPLWSRPLTEFPNDKINQYWPAGTTFDSDISRLLPNHYLDLVTWRSTRHYPKASFEPIPDKDLPDSIESIARVLCRHIGSVMDSTNRIYMPLTAGRDSRVLLACSKTWKDKVDYITFDYRPWRSEASDHIDLSISRRLAKRFGLHHTLVPIARHLPADTELQYLHRIGFAGGAGKSRDFFHACREHLDLSGAWITGFAGEVGRGFFWRANDRHDRDISPAELLDRMELPSLDRFQEAVRTWCDGLRGVDLWTLLDLAYLEHRVGCWAGPHFYGAAAFSINMTPFSHRDIFDIMLRLPITYRGDKALSRDIIATTWPDLRALPYNENHSGLRRLFARLM
jgi:hypothetical protein